VVICLERGADLHMTQLMPLPLTVSCFSKIQIGFTFLVPAQPGSPRQHTHTHPFNGPFPGLPRWASTRKVKPVWILVKQETVSGSGISWAICKSASYSRQTTTPAPHHYVFYRPDALSCRPTNSVKALKAHSPRQRAVKWLCVCVSLG